MFVFRQEKKRKKIIYKSSFTTRFTTRPDRVVCGAVTVGGCGGKRAAADLSGSSIGAREIAGFTGVAALCL